METRQLLIDGAIATAGGLAGSRLMNPVTQKISEGQTEESKRQEREASDAPAYAVAARKAAEAADVDLSETQQQKGGKFLHYALGVSWAPVYMLLRRKTRLTPWGAGTLTGSAMYALVDEVANPLLGVTPPPTRYPAVTHLRGLAGHLVFGLTLATVVEAGWRLTGRARELGLTTRR
ncbi:MAG TPA: DUF1440 domain-containing protein [Acidimicrobiia bacterium]|nr:DUF1440 domain-containing protein [Acidimicrobiia bacterium]